MANYEYKKKVTVTVKSCTIGLRVQRNQISVNDTIVFCASLVT